MPRKKCRISVSVCFAVFTACVLAADKNGLVSAALFAAVLHELGHLAATVWYRVPVKKIEFRLFGINIELTGGVSMSYGEEIVIALSGPAANLAAAGICLAAESLWPSAGWLLIAAAFHLLIAAFNLLPIAELDGGRALEALLCRYFSVDTAQKAVMLLSLLFIVPLGAAGFWVVLRSRGNFTLMAAAVYLAVSLFGKRGMFSRLSGRHSLQ